MKRWLYNVLTGPDNRTWDLVRSVTLMGVLVGLALQIFVVTWLKQAFSFTDFGIGMGSLVGAGAAGMWARKDVESVGPSVVSTTTTTVKE
jgi:hypothetical protein